MVEVGLLEDLQKVSGKALPTWDYTSSLVGITLRNWTPPFLPNLCPLRWMRRTEQIPRQLSVKGFNIAIESLLRRPTYGTA